MLDSSFLEKWVRVIVPPEYGPNKNLKANKPLLGVYITPSDKMAFIKDLWYKDIPKETKLFGQLVDIGEVLTLAGKENNQLKGRYVIRLNASQPETCGLFTLAHEVGHLYGLLSNDEAHKEDPDEYADNYAFKLIKRVIDDSTLRTKIFIMAFTHERV